MPEQIRIEISADNKAEGQLGEAARAVDNLNKKTQNLNNTLSQGAPVSDDFGDESAKAAIGVDDLGRRIFRSSDEARKFNGVFRDSQGRLRDATGQYARTRESVDELGDTFSKSSRQTRTFDEAIKNINIRLRNSNSAFVGVIRGAGNFSRIFVNATTGIGAFGAGLGKVLPLLGSLGVTIPIIADRVYRFGRSTIDAAAQMEQFQRGLVIVEGTGAPERLQELIEVANLPGINLDRLINYNNRLRALGLTATEIDALLLSTGQTIVTMGGNAHIAAEAVEQMIQALQTNTVTASRLSFYCSKNTCLLSSNWRST